MIVFSGFAIILFFVGFLSPLNPINGTGMSGTDSSVYRYIGKAMLEGTTIYKDVFDHKGPIMYFLNAIGYAINPLWGIWIINTFLTFVFFVYIYRIAKLYSDSIFVTSLSALVALFQYTNCYNGGNTVEGYCVVFIAIQLYVFLKFLRNNDIESYNAFLCGISAAIVCMLKINTIIVCVVYIPYVFYLLIKNRQYKQLLSIATGFVLGFFSVIIPIVIYLVYKGAFSHFIDCYFLFNFEYVSATTQERVMAFFHFLKNIVILIPLIFLVYRVIKYRKSIDIAAIIFILFSLLTIASPGRKYGYYAIILAPTIVYPCVVLIEKIITLINNKTIRSLFVVMVTICAAFIFIYRPVKSSYEAPTWTNEYIVVSKIVQENTQPTDKISVVGNANLVYLLSERDAATKYNFVPNALLLEAVSEIKQAEPKLIVLANKGEDVLKDFFVDKNYRNVYMSGQVFKVWVKDSK